MGKIKFYYSTMRAGKSTLALQINHNFESIGEEVLLVSTIDDIVESRVGLKKEAVHIKDIDLTKQIVSNIIIDEAQFLKPEEVEELTRLADNFNTNIYLFGLLTDYTGGLFLGSKKIIEVADELTEIQAKSLCWCGKKATHNMRIDKQGYPAIEGDVIGIGEQYETLCRKHFYDQKTEQMMKDVFTVFEEE